MLSKIGRGLRTKEAMTPLNFRIWSETATPEQVRDPRTLSLLRRYGCDLALAVRPWELASLRATIEYVQGAGISVAVWPMVEDAKGRWLSHGTLAAFRDFTAQVQAHLDGLTPLEIVLDIEPSLVRTAQFFGGGLLRGRLSTSAIPKRVHSTDDAYRTWIADLNAAGHAISTALLPTAILAPPVQARWARLLDLPTCELPAAAHHVMLYTSLFEGWSAGLCRRRDAEALLARLAPLAVLQFREKAAVALGTIGTGAFESEPMWRNPEELARDVGICRAAGVRAFSLFDLGGLLRRPPPEAWLESFTGASEIDRVAPTRRTQFAWRLTQLLGTALSEK